MIEILNKYSFIIATMLNLVAIFFFYQNAQFGEYFVYALDDPYIHLSIANNLLEFGHFGISNEFSSPSSSPLWNVILAFGIKIFGNKVELPFLINLILIIPLIYILDRQLDFIKKYKFLILIVFTLLLPIPTLVIIGMEHILHILLILLLFSSYFKHDKISLFEIFLLILLPLIRYESLFLTGLLFIFSIWNKNYKKGFLYLIIPFIGVSAFGIYSLQNGAFFLPNSLLLKGTSNFDSLFKFFFFFYKGLSRILEDYSMANIFLGLIILIVINIKNPKKEIILSLLILTHSLFAQFGWLFRYEGYLIALSIPVILKKLTELEFKNKNRIYFIAIIFFLPLMKRTLTAFNETRQTQEIIKYQHIQFTDFIKTYYNNDVVSVHDIGALSYYTNSKILDLFGLASTEIARMKRGGNFNSENIGKYLEDNNTKIIIVYRSWFSKEYSIPDPYKLAHQWETLVLGEIGEELIDFYIKEEDYIGFKANMDKFELKSNLTTKKDIKW